MALASTLVVRNQKEDNASNPRTMVLYNHQRRTNKMRRIRDKIHNTSLYKGRRRAQPKTRMKKNDNVAKSLSAGPASMLNGAEDFQPSAIVRIGASVF
jgi:hypothetical protein